MNLYFCASLVLTLALAGFSAPALGQSARRTPEDTVIVARYVDQNDPDAPVYEEAAAIIQNAGFEIGRLDIPGREHLRRLQDALRNPTCFADK